MTPLHPDANEIAVPVRTVEEQIAALGVTASDPSSTVRAGGRLASH
jgi:hypothetical protein